MSPSGTTILDMNTAPNDPSSFPELPTDRYRPDKQLGVGGVGVVYAAYDTSLKNRVAIKMLRTELASNQDVQRFQREARALSSLSHQNILRVLDFGLTASQQPYLVMDFIEGETLETFLENHFLDEAESVKLVRQLCSAMAHAHKKGVLHRDLKPNNILIENAASITQGKLGRPVLFDFGLARMNDAIAEHGGLTRPGQILGTAEYMSPEQARAGECTPQSDIYSLGCILFELLAGVPPFQDDSLLVVLQKHMNEAPPLAVLTSKMPPVKSALINVVGKALEKSPKDRFESMEEFDNELAKAVGDVPSFSLSDSIDEAASTDSGAQPVSDVRANLQVTTQLPSKRVRWATVGFAVSFLLATGIIAICLIDQPKKQTISNATPPKQSNFKLSEEMETAKNLWGTGILEGKVLHLSTVKGVDKIIRERFLEGIAVETVVADFSDISDQSLTYVGQWPVTNVVLSGSNISDKGLQALRGNQTIKQLYIDRCKNIHGDGLTVLPSLTNLVSLMLGSDNLVDTDLLVLDECPNLKFLKLNQSPNLTRATLANIRGIKNLRELTIGACPGLRESDVMQLRKLMPACKIAVGPDEVKTIIQKGDVWANFVDNAPQD
jgi:Serine/threonine protein kinase